MNILAIIPARSGSKTIVDKNIRDMAGKPMLAWSVEQALSSKLITRTIVSTDSEQYASIARSYGAETPFQRPSEFAQDESTDLEVFVHALDWLEEHEQYEADICVHLRPTYPVRRPEDIDAVIQTLIDNPNLDSVRTVNEVLHCPFKMWSRDSSGMLSPVAPLKSHSEPWNEPRQQLPTTYLQTANIDAVRASVIRNQGSMSGQQVFGYVEDSFFDIDTEEELQRAAQELTMDQPAIPMPCKQEGSLAGAPKTFCFDIDGVIATLVPGNDYRRAEPQTLRINQINALYQQGHRIVLFTARGSATGIDWSQVTEEQMNRWGVRHHELRFGKPAADYYIDDRMLSMHELDEFLADASAA